MTTPRSRSRPVRPRVDAHVLLAGAFGQGNPGDEALLRAFVRALPGATLTVTSSAPAATAREHRVAAVARHDARAMLRALRAADAVVFAGGTIFKRLHPSSGRPPLALLARAAALVAVIKMLRRPLAIVGVGAGDLSGRAAPRLARAIVRAADLLILRDDESAALLADAGAPAPMRVGADAAWTLPAVRRNGADGVPPVATTRSDDAGAGVTLRAELAAATRSHDAAAGASMRPHATGRAAAPRAGGPVIVALSHLAGGTDLSERLADALAPLARAGWPLALQPWDGAGDAELARAVAARLADPIELLPPPHDLTAAGERFASARLVVGLRFHGLIAAASAGTPFLAFVHEPKLAAVARRLGQPSVPAFAPPATVSAAVLAALDAPAAPAGAVRRERERAEHAFRLLRVLLAGGRTDEADAVDGLALRPEEWL